MRFEKVDPKKIAPRYKHTKLTAVMDEFAASEIPMARVLWDNGEYVSVSSAQAALSTAIKRNYKNHLKVQAINNELYLINLLLQDEETNLG